MQAWTVGSGGGADAAERLERAAADGVPVVVDADALAAVARATGTAAVPVLLTPHAGELARLVGADRDDVEARRLHHARAAARDLDAVVLLKGSTTVVARPDGRVRVNPTGTPALATAGSGDVLAGLCGALLAGGLDPFDAGSVGAWLHGLAGRLAAEGGAPDRRACDVLGRPAPAAVGRLARDTRRVTTGDPIASTPSPGSTSGAIRANVAALQARTTAEVMAVVKADGYGHGLVPSARAAVEGGATWLGTALLDEALALRAAGITEPRVLAWLLGPGERLGRRGRAPTSTCRSTPAGRWTRWSRRPGETGTTARVHLKVDTGLSRGGAALADWPDLVEAARKAEAEGAVRVVGLWSHFAYADAPGHPTIAAPGRGVPRGRRASPRRAGIDPEVRHLANSAATLTAPEQHFDLVRPGHRGLRALAGARRRPARRRTGCGRR